MDALAREAFAQVRGAAEDAGPLEFVVGPLPPAHGDRALIESVFVNLLGNAFKYTRGREKRRILVSGSSSDAENVYSVSDNGIGFDDRHAGKLFGAFERLHPPEQFEGAGIGLAIVARIIQRHGGRVWAESRPEQGATFFFSLARPERGRP
jgi:light-regulated signal transduction histidine kinase (bacteriophytochrome)